MEELKISNRQIAMMAFDRLRKENKKDSALRLARCLLQGTSISLGIGDIDWDIDTAIRQCGGDRLQVHCVFPLQPEDGDGKGKI